MLPFLDSPGDHRGFIIDISTRLLLGKFCYMVCWLVSCQLITSQQSLSIPIDGWYKFPEIEVLNICMLPFLDSPGDHRGFIIDISTRLLLGEFCYKVCWPVSCRLITSQQSSVNKYNRIVREQFALPQIVECLDAVDKMTRYCGFPCPNFLWAMIIKLYQKMTEIRVNLEKWRKILHPDSNYSPTVQMWYNWIHAYLQWIHLKEGKLRTLGTYKLTI